jgi:hypothetical protein
VQGQLDKVWDALQSNIPIPNPLQVYNPSGGLVAEIGDFVDSQTNIAYEGIWCNQFYAGGSGPGEAEFVVVPSGITINNVTITETGSGSPPPTLVISPTGPSLVITNGAGNATLTLGLTTGSGSVPEIVLMTSGGGGVEIIGNEIILASSSSGSYETTLQPDSLAMQDVNGIVTLTLETGPFLPGVYGARTSLVNEQNQITSTTYIGITLDSTGSTIYGVQLTGTGMSLTKPAAASDSTATNISPGVFTMDDALNNLLIALGVSGAYSSLVLQTRGSSNAFVVDTGSAAIVTVTGGNVLVNSGTINCTGGYLENGVAGLSTTVTLAKLTGSGSNGSITISGGIVTAYTAPS